MSFMLTTRQVSEGTKDVTRRIGWWNLKPGERLMAIEKGQGLKKGEKVVRIRVIEIVSTRREMLCRMKRSDLSREGFPEMRFKYKFVEMFCLHNKCEPSTEVNRIEFKYV